MIAEQIKVNTAQSVSLVNMLNDIQSTWTDLITHITQNDGNARQRARILRDLTSKQIAKERTRFQDEQNAREEIEERWKLKEANYVRQLRSMNYTVCCYLLNI